MSFDSDCGSIKSTSSIPHDIPRMRRKDSRWTKMASDEESNQDELVKKLDRHFIYCECGCFLCNMGLVICQITSELQLLN